LLTINLQEHQDSPIRNYDSVTGGSEVKLLPGLTSDLAYYPSLYRKSEST